MDIRPPGDELCSGGAAGLAVGINLATAGVAGMYAYRILRELEYEQTAPLSVDRAFLFLTPVILLCTLLGVYVARRGESGAATAVDRRLRFAAIVWVLWLAVGWFIPEEAIVSTLPFQYQQLAAVGIRLVAAALIPILATVAITSGTDAFPRELQRHFQGLLIGDEETQRPPDRRTRLGGALLWGCMGVVPTRIVTEIIKQPIQTVPLPYPLGFVGTALPWIVIGYWWTGQAVESRAEQRHLNAARLRFVAYGGALVVGFLILGNATHVLLPPLVPFLAVVMVSVAPVLAVASSYGQLLERVGASRPEPPSERWLEPVVGTAPLQSIAMLVVVGIAASLVLWTGGVALADYDRDGVANGREVLTGLDPAAPDTDRDGLDDAWELGNETSATTSDTDGDGLDDDLERQFELDPLDPDTDGDGTPDGRDSVEHTVPIRRGAETVSGATVTLRGPVESLSYVGPDVISNRTVGPQYWHVVEVSIASDTNGTITIPLSNRILKRHSNVTVYGVGPANYWLDDGWRALPTTVDRSNQIVRAALDTARLHRTAWITVSSPNAIRSASTRTVGISQDRLHALDRGDHWRFDGRVRALDGRFVFGGASDRPGRANRNLTVPDVTNVTLGVRVNETDPDGVEITLANDTQSIRIADDGNRTTTEPLVGDVSALRGERASLTIRGSNGSSVDYLWFQTHSDGDGIPDAGERAAANIPGLHCPRFVNKWRWLNWSDLDLDPHRSDTDRDGDDDAVEVHLNGTIDDENRTLTVSLRGYHSHPNQSNTWC